MGGLFSLFVDFSVFDEGYFSKYSVTLYRLCSVLDESVVIHSGRILFSGNKTGSYPHGSGDNTPTAFGIQETYRFSHLT